MHLQVIKSVFMCSSIESPRDKLCIDQGVFSFKKTGHHWEWNKEKPFSWLIWSKKNIVMHVKTSFYKRFKPIIWNKTEKKQIFHYKCISMFMLK